MNQQLTPEEIASKVGISVRALHEVLRRDRHNLTPREREVAVLLARGFSYKEIGTELGIGSDKTVSAHVYNLYRKLDIHSPVQALHWCLLAGWMDEPGQGLSEAARASAEKAKQEAECSDSHLA